MNILQVQDTLKDLSDAQLAQQMQNPDGSAPQFLVLSELQRRKEMRARAPQEAPGGTMAEEAVAGIAALPQAEPMQSPAQMMAEGGIVRMGIGGVPPLEDDPSLTPFQNMMRRRSAGQEERAATGLRRRQIDETLAPYEARRGALNYFFTPQGQRTEARSMLEWANQPHNREHLMSDPEALAAFRRDPAGYMRQRSELPPPPPAAPPEPTAPAAPAAPATTAPEAAPEEELPTPPIPPVPGAPARPGAVSRAGSTGGGGGGGGGAGGASGAAGVASLPQAQGRRTVRDVERELFGDNPADPYADLRAQIDAGRTDPAARRSEAMNMALIEGGLRIAGSNNAGLAALADAAPAVQGYGRQLGDIRKDQRDDVLTRLQLERGKTEDTFRRTQVAAGLFSDENRNATSLRAAEIQAAATRANAGRNQQLELLERAARDPAIMAALVESRRDPSLSDARAAQADAVVFGRFGEDINKLRDNLFPPNAIMTQAQREANEARYRAERDEILQRYTRRYPNLFGETGAGTTTTQPAAPADPLGIRR